jgi:hypothetical protein
MNVHRTRNRRRQDDLNISLARWKYDKQNPFTQHTSLNRTRNIRSLPQLSPAHH